MTSKQQQGPIWSAVRPFAIGGFSACMATCIVQPMDMIKVRIQLAEASAGAVNKNPFSVGMHLIKTEGPLFLYNGLSAGLIRQLTYGMTRLGLFRTLTNRFTEEGKSAADLPFSTKFGCSLAAGGFGALVGTPADAALVRMQADTMLPEAERRNYKNGLDALVKMARNEGVSGFFSGATPTIFRGLSINVGMLTTYDSYKKFFGPKLDGVDGQTNRFFSGFLSGWTAATLCLPFDMIKTRLQKQKPDAKGVLPYKGIMDCGMKMVAQDGVLSLYQGYWTFVFRITPHIMCTWVIMDNVKALLKKGGL